MSVRRSTIPPDIGNYIQYDPLTGIFTQKVSMGPAIAGAQVGHIDHRNYLVISFRRRHYFAQRLAWFLVHGEPMPIIVDHINCDTLDNRLENLRAATHSQNVWNQRRSNPLGKGVYIYRPNGKFAARVRANHKDYFLGYHDTAEQAREAVAVAVRNLHGEFARTE